MVDGRPEGRLGSVRERLSKLVTRGRSSGVWVWYSSSVVHRGTLINYLASLRPESFRDLENRDKDRDEHFIWLFVRIKWVSTQCLEEDLVYKVEHPLSSSITHYSLHLWKHFSCLSFLRLWQGLGGRSDGCCFHLREGKLGDYLYIVGAVPELRLYPSAFLS